MEKRFGVIAALLLTVAAPVVGVAQPQKPGGKKPPPPASASASASAAPAPPANEPPPAKLEAAKDFFRKGNAEMEAGRFERALDYFLQSKGQVPSIANTNNAALCLEKLGRNDEALDLYEELLTAFAPRLTSDERTAISNKVAALRAQVGFVEVTANVDGLLTIDGRRRGNVPASAPLRVSPGTHQVRVIKDGHTPAEATIAVSAGQTVKVDLKLQVLTEAGRLRVTDASGAADAEVLVDGAPVGVTPWEGTLSPGRHLIALRGKLDGTAPTEVNVVVGQTVKAELVSKRLGPPLRAAVDPPTASVRIDGVLVGAGAWSGRLPDGEHAFQVNEEGYQTETVMLGGTEFSATIKLVVDEKHPRWRKIVAGKWRVGAEIGLLRGSELGGGGESNCQSSCTSSGVSGSLLAATLAYHSPSRIFFTGSVGLLEATHRFKRTVPAGTSNSPSTLSYQLDDSLSIRGPFALLGVGYRLPLSSSWSLLGQVGAGAMVVKAADPIRATISGFTSEAVVDKSGETARGVAVLVRPSVSAEVRLGKRVLLGFGLGAVASLLDGPDLPHGDLGPSADACVRTQNGALDPTCTKATAAVAKEQAYSRFVLWTPQLSLGWELLSSRRSCRCTTARSRPFPLPCSPASRSTPLPAMSPRPAPSTGCAGGSLRRSAPGRRRPAP